MELVPLMLFVLVGAVIYFLPSFLAFFGKKKSRWLILMLNLTVGWTVIGWVLCMVAVFLGQQAGAETWTAKLKRVEERQTIQKRQQQLIMERRVGALMARFEATRDEVDLLQMNLTLREYESLYGRLPDVYIRSAKAGAEELIEKYKKTHDETLVPQIQYLNRVAREGKTPPA